MKHKETGLLVVLIAGILKYLTEMIFLENVPHAATNGQLAYIFEQLSGRYIIYWGTFKVSDLGGHIVRERLCILLYLRRFKPPQLPHDCIIDMLARMGPEPARCVEIRTRNWKAALGLVGNAAHPASALHAYAVLAGWIVAMPVATTLRMRLTFDPLCCYDEELFSRATTPMLRKPVFAIYWAGPRRSGGWGAYVNGFTVRGLCDLATQVRYEAGTPDHMRWWPINPLWTAWLMGFPAPFAALLAQV